MTSPEPGKPLSETELKPCPFCGEDFLWVTDHIQRCMTADCILYFRLIRANQISSAHYQKTITQQAAQIRAYGKALVKIASYSEGPDINGSFDEPYSAETARDVLKQYPLSGSEVFPSGNKTSEKSVSDQIIPEREQGSEEGGEGSK